MTMRKITRMLLLGAVATLALLPAPAEEEQPATATRLALTGLDPVALSEGKQQPGSEQLAVDHEGFRYLFASEASRERFTVNPDRYAIQLDGQCAAMQGARGNPGLFTVHEKKIYLFGSTGCREQFLAEPATYLAPRKEVPRMNVAIMVYEGVELLDFAGPGEVFAAADHGRAFEVYTVAPTSDPVVSQGFVEVKPAYSVADAPEPDVVVIPGGGISSVIDHAPTMAWLRKTAEHATIMSVCNGALALAELGLLDGLEATTHHGSIGRLRGYEAITVHDDARYVDNGKLITTAGVSAGIDGALHLVERLLGGARARSTARYMEYDWQPGRGVVTEPAKAR